MIAAWEKLRERHLSLWLVIGLARFAGLRLGEIKACRAGWVVKNGPDTHIEIKIREDEQFIPKKRKRRLPRVIHPALAEYLRSVTSDGPLVNEEESWTELIPQGWVRPFCPDAVQPVHRLRKEYAAQTLKDHEGAILAREAATKEVAKNLGHSNVSTTVTFYLGTEFPPSVTK